LEARKREDLQTCAQRATRTQSAGRTVLDDARQKASAARTRALSARARAVSVDGCSRRKGASESDSGEKLATAGEARTRDGPPPAPAPARTELGRQLLVLSLAARHGYWAELDACVGVCARAWTDAGKDGLLHLTMSCAARGAAEADAAYAGPRGWPDGPPGQWTRLHQAAHAGPAGRVPVLVAAGAAIAARDELGRTPLFWAAERGAAPVVAALLACPGVDVNAAGTDGSTPLASAAAGGHAAAVAALLACPGVTLHPEDAHGFTPLYWAARGGHSAVVAALLAFPGALES